MGENQYNAGSFWTNPSLQQGSGGSFWSNPSATYGQTGYLSGNMDAQQFFGTNGIGQSGGGNWFQSANNWMGGESFLGSGISNGALASAGMGVLNMGVNLLAGKNHTKVGDIMQTVGGIASNIPGVGGLIGAGVGVLGGLVNAAFGSHINEEFVNQTQMQANAVGNRVFNANTNADVLNDWGNYTEQSLVNQSDVGSDGWFSSKASDKRKELNQQIQEANRRQLANFNVAVENADKNTDFRIMQNMAAYGGPINSFRKYYGGGGFINLITTPMPGTTNNETVRDILSWLPYTSTAIDIDNARKDPSASNLTWAGVSAGLDLLSAGVYSKLKRGLRAVDKAIGVAEKEAASATKRAERAKKVYEQAHTKKNYEINLKAEREAFEKNYRLNNAVDGLYTQRQSYLDDINKYAPWTFEGMGGVESQAIQTFVESARDNTHACGGRLHGGGGYLNQAKALIRQNEGWREKPYKDAPKGKNWRSVGYGFNDSGFRDKYPEGISKHYEHGITKKQAEEELDYFLNKAEKQLKSIYGKQWNDFTDSQKAAILDTYYQRPASVGKGSRFYKAVTAGEDADRYLGVAGFDRRNKIRQGVFGGSQDYVNLGIETGNTESNPSTLQEVTPFTPVVHDLDLSGITPTQAKALELNLASPVFDLSMFSKPSTPIVQQQTPAIGTVEDFLASYGDFEENLFAGGGWMDFFNMWNQSQGGNNYFGNNWKPSDGLQRTTSNGNVGDWMGVAGTTINTLANWGKEDPSLGRGGGYSTFGMAAYDIMKAIRNATKSKRESIGQKLGIPIYAQGGHLFSGGGNIGALGYANIANSALKLASNVKHQTELDIDPDKVYRSADRYGMGLDEAVANVNTNGDLLDLWANNSTVSANLSGRDFRNKSYFDDFLDSYAASWEGFNAGQNFGPWGAAIGAIIGGGSSVIGSIIGRNKADNAAETANRRLENANERRAHNLIAAAERVDEENDLRILQNMDNQGANGGKLSMGFGLRNPFIMPDGTANPLFRAFGGGLTHGSDWDTGINWVNEGGSHGENPLGGVQMGVDEQGVPNLVEEGEAIWNGDYVFSKRMKVPKKLAKKYGLGGDLTFADAIAKLTKDSEERPLSNIDRATNDHILGEFADTQEELRMAKAQRAMDKEVQLQDDFLTGFQFGLGGHMSPIGIIPDSDNTSIFEKVEQLYADGGGIHIDPSKKGTFKAQASKMGMGVQEAASHILANKEDYSPAMVRKANFAKIFAHADGGDLFSNPFAYGGELGNVFAGEGNRPNILNLDAANQSLVRRIFGDTGFTRFMENTSAALNDPLGYFAGDEINAVIDKLGKMSEPQLERFFRTDIGRAIAPYLAGDDNSQVQESGMRGAKSVANIVRRVQRPVQIAAKKAMAQSRQAARGQMRTPKGGGSQKVLNETMTPTQAARQATTGSTEGLPQGWNFTRGNTSTVTNTSGVTGRLNPKSPTGKAATSRGTAPDPFAGLEGTLNMRAPIGSGNFGYLPWAAGIGAGGYGLYKGIDWLADNLTNPDGTINGVNDPVTQAAINSLPSETTSNRGNGNKGKAAATETSAITPEETGAASTRRGSQGTSRGRGNSSGSATRSSVGPTGLNYYGADPIETFKYWDKETGDYDEGYRDFIENKLNEDWITRVMNGQYGDMSRYKGANKVNPTVEQAWQLGLDKKNSDWHKAMAAAYDEYQKGIDPKTGKANTPAVEWPDENWEFDPYSEGWEARRGISTEPVTTKPDDKGITKSPFKPKQTWTRYAPIAMNALFGLKEMLTPADYANADAIMAAAYQAGAPVSVGTEYIGDYRKRDPFDERYLMNIINQRGAAANRNFMNLSGGNRAVAMSGILANDLTTQMSLAEAARQAYLANRADDAQVAEFNRGTNIFNAQAQNTRNLSLAQLNSQRQNAMLSGIAQGARLRQAIKDQRDAAISANLTNFAQGLGDLGKENGYYNMLGGLNEEGILKYFYGDDWKTKFNNVNV